MSLWSPYDICVMMHHHHIVGPWPLGATSAYSESLRKLRTLGLLNEQTLETTPKGDALVRLWCEQPVPVEQFVDPRFQSGKR